MSNTGRLVFFPFPLLCEVPADIVAPQSRALQSQDTGAMVLACLSAVLASRLWRPDEEASSQLRVPQLLHK